MVSISKRENMADAGKNTGVATGGNDGGGGREDRRRQLLETNLSPMELARNIG